MRKINAILTFLVLALAPAGVEGAVYPFIPLPAECTAGEGIFTVPDKWTVGSDLDAAAIERLVRVLPQPSAPAAKGEAPNLLLETDTSIVPEGYTLDVMPGYVRIAAADSKGLYYALQSLSQLVKANAGSGEIACLAVKDYPRFGHRGLMLDATRYFVPKEEVLKLIDEASALKLNKLHLHLCDDNGWRLEIRKYPKLTDVGAWRVSRDVKFPGRVNQTDPNEPTPVGGFYTQDDMREIVAYAAERFIDVIPEIEMPAHSAAAIASYPELACPVVDKFVGVYPGIGGEDASIIMCAGNDSVFTFYENVLDEVMDIFPSEYIHLGGDEADKSVWKQCPLCKERMEHEHLADYEELQGYFMDRMNRYVQSKGRKTMAWDEVTYGQPKEDITILGWQGMGNVAVRDARTSGRNFILTPAKVLYLLRYQGPQWFEPFTYFGNNRLVDVYNYEPVGADWTDDMKNRLDGIQGSLWTEFCQTPYDVEYLLFPRLIAVADGAWRREGSGDWSAFVEALDTYLPNLEANRTAYARSMYNIQHKAVPNGEGVTVTLECERPDVEIRYSLDGSAPTMQSALYTHPVDVKGATTLTAATWKHGKQAGKTLTLKLGHNKATGRKVTAPGCNNELQDVLTNGVRGSERQSDFEWAGWHDRDGEFTVDLGEIVPVKGARLGALAHSDICVAMPAAVEILASTDGVNFTPLASVETPAPLVFAKEPTRHDYNFGQLDAKARYVKFVAANPGKIPAGYARSSKPSWIYFDEVAID